VTSIAARYAIIQFLPDQDAEEFTNVGIVLAASAPEQIAWLLTRSDDTARLAGFFGEWGARLYRDTARAFAAEIDRLAELVNGGWLSAQTTMDGLLKRRDGVLRFSAPRAIMVEDCATAAADLFQRLVQQRREPAAPQLSRHSQAEAPERG